jgi:hypothetical protein
MTGIHEFKIANCFVAKLVNIPDINCVSRLAFDDFNSHSCSPRLIKRFPKIINAIVDQSKGFGEGSVALKYGPH